jgi:hypothetical protein
VYWWHFPYIYIEVHDSRLAYPYSMRALVSFDLTNGGWASHESRRRYAFARRGWRSFLADLLHCQQSHVTHYGEESAEEGASREAAAEIFARYGHHHCEPCAICALG